MTKVLIAMSGGVDSSVAAKLSRDSGYECVGCTMKLYENEDAGIPRGHTCCSLDDVEDARAVAYSLGMPYYVFNFSHDFKKRLSKSLSAAMKAVLRPIPALTATGI